VVHGYSIRAAATADIDILIAFTIQEAVDAEGIYLSPERVRRGVAAAFANPPRAHYWVAENGEGRIVASTSAVTEWSNFHGGDYWWVQSLFIVPEHRGRGLVEILLNHLARTATESGALELRLYGHSANERALRAYKRCGFSVVPYTVMRRNLGV
jgi:ribosomal protein S18 acetylase RimI-like enzyme